MLIAKETSPLILHLIAAIPATVSAALAAILAWLQRRQLREVHVLINGRFAKALRGAKRQGRRQERTRARKREITRAR